MSPILARKQPGTNPTVADQEGFMIPLDETLLFSARNLSNSVNTHRLKQMIFAYEQAVELHNQQVPRHQIYQMRSEMELRNFVWESQSASIKERTESAVARA